MVNALNENQKKAITETEGPVLVLSGAGTGKTTVVTERIANIISQNQGHGVIAMTFTNKAAREMKERIEKNHSISLDNLIIGTFHSISVRFLRRYAKFLNLSPNFTILSESESSKTLSDVANFLKIDTKLYPVKLLSSIISSAKEKGIHFQDDEIDISYRDISLSDLYKEYCRRLRIMNVLDFDDLILEFYRLISKNNDVLTQIVQKYQYIMVDEYQDTNSIQNKLILKLSQKTRNLCCVGDEDQSIYSWRGADIQNILNFKTIFPDAKIIKLEENYRSTKSIINAAMEVISINKSRYEKKLFSSKEDGDGVSCVYVNDSYQESFVIVNLIKKGLERFSESQIAILFRKNSQIKSVEDALMRSNIKYKVLDGVKFYERKEIKDVLSFIKICANKHDFISFERIVGMRKCGIGEKKINEIIEFAIEKELNISSAILEMDKLCLFKENIRIRLVDIANLIEKYSKKLEMNENLYSFTKNILEESGYMDDLVDEIKENESENYRFDNIKELLETISEFEFVLDLLEHVSLVSSSDVDNENAVTLMTIHASKGLEYDFIILPGWEEGIMPSSKSENESGYLGIEEERRLAYVAITRAKKMLFLTCVKERRVYGKILHQMPSRFLKEIPSMKSIFIGFNPYENDSNSTDHDDLYLKSSQVSNVDKKISYAFKVDDKVFHEKYKTGVILKIFSSFAEVQFDKLKMVVKLDFLRKI